ncbi:MAG: ACP S-malonyltransferase [Planctomycetota bacterium]|nr:ACP S-malonyltransferase [Planctomycetota bacterium]
MSTAILCPGQGAQKVGMGVAWSDSSAAAREIFHRCSETLGFDLAKLCAEGPAEELTRTDVCQPAILAVSAASLAAREEKAEAEDRANVQGALGLSLGEYTALYVAGVLLLEDAVRLVRLRGIAMQEASDDPPSGMTSVIGADREAAEALCAKASADGGVCVVANLNCPGQVVISGDNAALDRADAIAEQEKVGRTVRLDVAGAFHSPLMEPARGRLEEAIAQTEFKAPQFSVVSNATGEPSKDPETLRCNLVRQLTSPVLFEASLRRTIADGTTEFLELSPGRVLAGFMRKIDRGFPVEICDGRAA